MVQTLGFATGEALVDIWRSPGSWGNPKSPGVSVPSEGENLVWFGVSPISGHLLTWLWLTGPWSPFAFLIELVIELVNGCPFPPTLGRAFDPCPSHPISSPRPTEPQSHRARLITLLLQGKTILNHWMKGEWRSNFNHCNIFCNMELDLLFLEKNMCWGVYEVVLDCRLESEWWSWLTNSIE